MSIVLTMICLTFILNPGLLHQAEPFPIGLGKVSAYETPKGIVVVLRNLWDQVLFFFSHFSGPVETSANLSLTLSPALFLTIQLPVRQYIERRLTMGHIGIARRPRKTRFAAIFFPYRV